MKHRNLVALTLLSLLAVPLPASALCTILCSCSVSASAVSFGVYNPLSASSLPAVGNVQVTCGGVLGLLVPYEIALSKGSYSAVFSPREMASGANRLNYDLYTTVAHATVWGDGSGGTSTVSDSINIALLGGTSRDHSVYGLIPGSQTTVPPGSYGDTVVVTVTYQ